MDKVTPFLDSRALQGLSLVYDLHVPVPFQVDVVLPATLFGRLQ